MQKCVLVEQDILVKLKRRIEHRSIYCLVRDITNKQQGSFVNDESGNQIIFVGCAFECIL